MTFDDDYEKRMAARQKAAFFFSFYRTHSTALVFGQEFC